MASPRWKGNCSKRVKLGQKYGRNAKMPAVKLADVICPVCLCILIEPVTMPCHHNLCMPCFQHNVQETSLLCPVCRKRISSWSRKAARENCLINKVLWKTIQDAFPDKVKRRQLGKESDTEEDNNDDEEMIGPPVKISEPGEIRKEYETQLKKLHEEDEKERERENQKSSALIKVLQEEEERLRIEAQQQAQKDHMIALLLMDQIQELPAVEEAEVIHSVLHNIDEVLRPASTICTIEVRRPNLEDSRRSISSSAIPRHQSFGANDKKSSSEEDKDNNCNGDNKNALCNEAPGKCNGKLSRSNSLDSEDSITPELRHFRPIKTAPKTPPLRLPDGRIQETPLIHATPRVLVFDSHICESDRRGLLHKRLSNIEEDRRKRFDAGINMDRLDTSQLIRKQNLFRPLAPFSASPGNCALGAKPEKKYALSDLAANKENPKTTNRKRKLQDDISKTEISKKQKGMLGRGDINVPQKFHPKSQASGHLPKQESTRNRSKLPPPKSQASGHLPKQELTRKRSKLPPPKSHVSKSKSQRQDPEEEAALKCQEEADRVLALELHRELNCKHNVVDRRIGTKGEYFLRSRDNEVSFQLQSTTEV